MNPDVASAVLRLQREGVLSPAAVALVLPVARGERLSVHAELRTLLYLGVLLITAGAGVLVQQNLDRIGPLAVAIGLGVGAALCLAFVVRVGPPFGAGEVASPNLAFDYVLLLGVLLAAADLAYVEAQFTTLGPRWPLHFLLVAAFAGALAFRYDSRALFSLALGSLAAWRGVAISFEAVRLALPGGAPEVLRANALGLGAVFVLAGVALARGRLKPHFEGVATHLGTLLVLGGMLSGCGFDTMGELQWSLLLLLTSSLLALLAVRLRRFSLFVMGTLGACAALLVLIVRTRLREELLFLLLAASALGLLFGLVRAKERLRETL
jgi:hypothetical protein